MSIHRIYFKICRIVLCGIVCYHGMLLCGMVPAIPCVMVWYGMVTYRMVTYGMVTCEVYGIITVRYGWGGVLS